jgi:hypothetical protein
MQGHAYPQIYTPHTDYLHINNHHHCEVSLKWGLKGKIREKCSLKIKRFAYGKAGLFAYISMQPVGVADTAAWKIQCN